MVNRQAKKEAKWYDNPLNKRIRELLESRKIKNDVFAATLAVTPEAVRLWCAGYARPDIDRMVDIARYFNVTTDYLLGLENNKTHENAKVNDLLGLSDEAINSLKEIASCGWAGSFYDNDEIYTKTSKEYENIKIPCGINRRTFNNVIISRFLGGIIDALLDQYNALLLKEEAQKIAKLRAGDQMELDARERARYCGCLLSERAGYLSWRAENKLQIVLSNVRRLVRESVKLDIVFFDKKTRLTGQSLRQVEARLLVHEASELVESKIESCDIFCASYNMFERTMMWNATILLNEEITKSEYYGILEKKVVGAIDLINREKEYRQLYENGEKTKKEFMDWFRDSHNLNWDDESTERFLINEYEYALRAAEKKKLPKEKKVL